MIFRQDSSGVLCTTEPYLRPAPVAAFPEEKRLPRRQTSWGRYGVGGVVAHWLLSPLTRNAALLLLLLLLLSHHTRDAITYTREYICSYSSSRVFMIATPSSPSVANFSPRSHHGHRIPLHSILPCSRPPVQLPPTTTHQPPKLAEHKASDDHLFWTSPSSADHRQQLAFATSEHRQQRQHIIPFALFHLLESESQ